MYKTKFPHTNRKKGIVFTYISSKTKSVLKKKSHLTVVHQAQYQNSIVFTPQLRANPTVCQVYLFASVQMLKRT